MSYKGIDISNYQSNLDFNKVDAEVCIIKATEGLTYTSPSFKVQYALAKLQGMKVGFYHFLRGNDPIAEAKHFLQAIEGLQSDCKYIIDAENKQEAAGVSARIRKFADYLISQGKEPCLYTYSNFYETEILPIVRDLPLWVADYGTYRPLVKSIGWQYCGIGLDLNIFDEGIFLTNVKNNVILTSAKATTVQTKPNGNEFIKRLQRELNKQYNSKLIVDGYIGKLTLNACPMMKITARGNITKLLQEKLGVGADGIFGANTFNSVKTFQKKHGLSADGIVGNATWSALLK